MPSPHPRGLSDEESSSSTSSLADPEHNSTTGESLSQSSERVFGLPNREEEWSVSEEHPERHNKWAFLQRTTEALRSPSSAPEVAEWGNGRPPRLRPETFHGQAKAHDLQGPELLPSVSTSTSPHGTAESNAREEDASASFMEDDRTLLDLFAESAKEYLTTKMIPPTDPECHWDWRYMQCEPACHCCFQYKAGDYHLGRSCRLGEEVMAPLGECPANSEHILDQPVPKRLLSLVGQTSQILLDKSTRALLRLKAVQQLQHEVCDDLWSLQEARECLLRSEMPARTIPERLLCGPVAVQECPVDQLQRTKQTSA